MRKKCTISSFFVHFDLFKQASGLKTPAAGRRVILSSSWHFFYNAICCASSIFISHILGGPSWDSEARNFSTINLHKFFHLKTRIFVHSAQSRKCLTPLTPVPIWPYAPVVWFGAQARAPLDMREAASCFEFFPISYGLHGWIPVARI